MKKKRLRQILTIVVLLFLVLVLALWFSINAIIREQVDSRATAALGVKATLSQVALNILGGSLALKGLNIANPAGFSDPSLLDMKSCKVTVKIGSLLGQTVQITTIAIDGLTVTLDQNGLNSNIQDILNNIKKNTAPAGNAGTSTPAASKTQRTASGGKALAINQVILTHLTVIFRPSLIPGQKGLPITIPIKKLVIDQPTNPDGRPLRIADLFGQVLSAIAIQAAKSPQIPAAFRNSLQAAGGILGAGAGDLLNGTSNLGKSLGNGVQNTFKAFGNLIPGQSPATNASGAAK